MTSSNEKCSIETTFSDTICENENMKYDLNMINEYEENLTSSLSFISGFNLEDDNLNKEDNSFNPEDNDDLSEQIEINTKRIRNSK